MSVKGYSRLEACRLPTDQDCRRGQRNWEHLIGFFPAQEQLGMAVKVGPAPDYIDRKGRIVSNQQFRLDFGWQRFRHDATTLLAVQTKQAVFASTVGTRKGSWCLSEHERVLHEI